MKGAILGGVSAATAWGIGHGFGKNWDIGGKALAHGATQGGFSELRGGSFRDGFIGGSIGKLGGAVVHDNIPENMQLIGMTAVAGIAGLATGGNSDTYLRAAVSAITVYLYNALGKAYQGAAKMAEALQPAEEVNDEFNAYTKTPGFKSDGLGFLANRADNVATGCLAVAWMPCASLATGTSIGLSMGSGYYDYQKHQNVNEAAVAGVATALIFKNMGDTVGHIFGGKMNFIIDFSGNTVDFLFDEAASR